MLLLDLSFKFHLNFLTLALNLLAHDCFPSNALYNIHHISFTPMTCFVLVLFLFRLLSCFLSLKALLSHILPFTTVKSISYNLHHFHPFNLKLSGRYELDPKLEPQHQVELNQIIQVFYIVQTILFVSLEHTFEFQLKNNENENTNKSNSFMFE